MLTPSFSLKNELGSSDKGSCILIFEEGKGFFKSLTACSDFGFEVSWGYSSGNAC